MLKKINPNSMQGTFLEIIYKDRGMIKLMYAGGEVNLIILTIIFYLEYNIFCKVLHIYLVY